MKSMERWLLGLVQVSQCDLSASSPTKEKGEFTLGLPKRNASMDFAWLDQTIRSVSGTRLLQPPVRKDTSECDLLKLWEGAEKVTDADLQQLQHLELAAFFTGPGRGSADDISSWLQRGNLEEWVAHYFLRDARPASMTRREKEELDRLVDMVLDSFGLLQLPGGSNPAVKCHKLVTDPLNVNHRPLWMYGCTSVLCPLITNQVMTALGFERERIGGLVYWKRGCRKDVQPAADVTGQMPLVFVHGLGVGLVPYYLLLYRLSQRHSGEFFVPEFPFLAMAPWENVPSAREVVAQMQDMLMANGHTAAHFAGHSFGAVVIGWVMKMSPSSVIITTLMEPANFLLMKSDSLCTLLHGIPKTCYEKFIQFCAFRELFTMNLLCRNTFWEQSSIWPEEIHVPCIIELAGDDHIVSSLFVRRLLEHERQARRQARKQQPKKAMRGTGSAVELSAMLKAAQQPRVNDIDIMWCDGFLHGEILFRPQSQDQLFEKMKQVRLQFESAR